MALLTVEKENALTIRGARLSKESRAVLVDILEKTAEHVLSIEQHVERLFRPERNIATTSVAMTLATIAESDIARMQTGLPYAPREPLTSLRALGACLLELANIQIQQGVQDMRDLKGAASALVQAIDKALPSSYYIPHDNELLTLDKQIFASCKRVCMAIQERTAPPLNQPPPQPGPAPAPAPASPETSPPAPPA